LSQVHQSKYNEKKAKELAMQYVRNRGYHFRKIVEENQNFWKSYQSDCLVAAENECLSKNGNYSTK